MIKKLRKRVRKNYFLNSVDVEKLFFKYSVDMENYGSFKSFGYIYIYIYI